MLERFERRVRRWPTPARWAFAGVKWGLVALGAWCWIGMWFTRSVWLGVAQAIGAQISPGWQILAGHLVFFLVLAVRPKGLFPRMD